jgi:hypothetical protein
VGQFLYVKLLGEWKMFGEGGRKVAMGRYTQSKQIGKSFFWDDTMLREVDFVDRIITNVTQRKGIEQLAVMK